MCVLKKETLTEKQWEKKTQKNKGRAEQQWLLRKLEKPEQLRPYLDESHGLDKHNWAAESKKKEKKTALSHFWCLGWRLNQYNLIVITGRQSFISKKK